PMRARRASSLSCRANFSESFIPDFESTKTGWTGATQYGMGIERLTHLTPELLVAPIAESEAQGLGFVRRLADGWASGGDRFERPGEALFAVRDAADIVALGGLNVDPYTTAPGTGRVRHVYVLMAHRRRGLGAALVSEIIAAARGHFHTLRLSTSN